MKRILSFNTPAEAIAFIEGVRYVNGNFQAVTAMETPGDPLAVTLNEEPPSRLNCGDRVQRKSDGLVGVINEISKPIVVCVTDPNYGRYRFNCYEEDLELLTS